MIYSNNMEGGLMFIGIGGLLRAGKTTFAKYIAAEFKESEVSYCPFSQALKEFAFKLGWNGKKDEKGRRLLQLLGTEIGRDCINENIWVYFWDRKVQRDQGVGKTVIIADDVRFDNEARRMRELGGLVVGIERDIEFKSNHRSEQGIDPNLIDHIILNDSTLNDLERKARILVKILKEANNG